MIEAAREWMIAVGTVGAVLVALFWSTFLGYLRRPELVIAYEPREPFCRPTDMVDIDDGSVVPSFWIRVKVSNGGRSTAQGCKGRLVAVCSEDGEARPDRDSMLLRWALAGMSEEHQLEPLDLAPKEWDFLNVVYATSRRADAVFIATDPRSRPGFATLLEAGRTHRITVAVYADNAAWTRAEFIVRYDGTLDSLAMSRL